MQILHYFQSYFNLLLIHIHLYRLNRDHITKRISKYSKAWGGGGGSNHAALHFPTIC